MVAFDWQGMTSYYCSVVTLGELLKAVNVITKKKKLQMSQRMFRAAYAMIAFSALTLLVGRQEGIRPVKH